MHQDNQLKCQIIHNVWLLYAYYTIFQSINFQRHLTISSDCQNDSSSVSFQRLRNWLPQLNYLARRAKE